MPPITTNMTPKVDPGSGDTWQWPWTNACPPGLRHRFSSARILQTYLLLLENSSNHEIQVALASSHHKLNDAMFLLKSPAQTVWGNFNSQIQTCQKQGKDLFAFWDFDKSWSDQFLSKLLFCRFLLFLSLIFLISLDLKLSLSLTFLAGTFRLFRERTK